jgi:nucleotide-binding universal stress UspA family protein
MFGSEGGVMTYDFKRILIPTDLSDFSGLALKYGALFAGQAGSELTLLFVEDAYIPIDLQAMPLVHYLENAPASRDSLMEKLAEQARLYAPGVRVQSRIVTEAPSRGIVETANDIDADLIIMGTHGRHGVERAFLGSVTERVLRDTDRAVFTVSPLHFALEGEIAIRRILCPVNFTPVGREALTYAAGVAATFHAELVVTYVVESGENPLLSHEGKELASWIAPAVGERIKYREIIAHGDAAIRVLETAAEVDADLMVIGSQHKFFSDTTVIGTTTERVTRFARIPVITVPFRLASEGQDRNKRERFLREPARSVRLT